MLKIGGQRVPHKTVLLVLADSVLIVIGLLLASGLRLYQSGLFSSSFEGMRTVLRFGVVVLVCELSLYYHDLYDFQILKRHSEMFARLLQAFGISCAVLALCYYVHPPLSLGRGIAALAAPTILAFSLGWRLLLDKADALLHRPERVLIVGTGPAGISLTREIISRPELNLKVVGFLDEKGENIGKSLVNPGIIGAVSEVSSIADMQKVDRIVLSLAERRGCTPSQQLLHLKFAGVPVEDAHSCYERISGRILLERLSPSWLILSSGFRKSAFVLACKRVADIIAALFGLVLSAPVMAAVAVAIWLETGSPILFRQTRTGLFGRHFQILKFRSMYQNAEASGPAWAAQDDRRITRVGAFIRKSRLDELPQLFNVLRGDMSLVGPRPEQPHFVTLLQQSIPFYDQRHTVRPGITGWAQIKYQYGASLEESKVKLELDLFYIKHLSTLLDLAIIFETVKVMLLGRGAK